MKIDEFFHHLLFSLFFRHPWSILWASQVLFHSNLIVVTAQLCALHLSSLFVGCYQVLFCSTSILFRETSHLTHLRCRGIPCFAGWLSL